MDAIYSQTKPKNKFLMISIVQIWKKSNNSEYYGQNMLI